MNIIFKYGVYMDDMNEEAFKYCRKALYPYMEFQVIKENDVRKLDVQEWLTRLEQKIFPEIRKKTHGSPVTYYVYLLKKYMSYLTRCEKGSRADRYYNRAFEALDMHLKHYNDRGMKDAVEIFVSLLRLRKETPENVGKTVISNTSFACKLSDIDVLKIVFDKRFSLPEGVYEKEGIFAKEDEDIKTAIKLFFFAISVLTMTDNLQDVGFFVEEGKE